jgi:cysteinyl-tRNA synthetase
VVTDTIDVSDGAIVQLTDADIQRLIEERRAARAAKDFKESDRIRDELTKAGIILEDKPGSPTTWRRA